MPNVLSNNTIADADEVMANFDYLETLILASSGSGGWISGGETWTYVSVDDPTGIIKINSDVTTKYSAGMRIKFTNGGNTIYGLIQVVGTYGGTEAGYTYITFLHEIDPTDSLALYLMANSAITSNYYSTQKAPFGFPMDKAKWTIKKYDSTQRTAAGTGGTYLNVGTTNSQITIPIGLWDVDYQVYAFGNRTTAGTGDALYVALSTANNTASDIDFVSLFLISGAATNQSDSMGAVCIRSKLLSLSSKTLYYLNMKMDNNGAWYFNNDTSSLLIRAVNAYL